MTLDAALKSLKLSDADFGKLCEVAPDKRPIHRTQVWAYRTFRSIPRGDTAAAMLAVLRRRGVDMTLAELLSAPRVARKRKRAA